MRDVCAAADSIRYSYEDYSHQAVAWIVHRVMEKVAYGVGGEKSPC